LRTRSLLQPRIGAVLALVDPAQHGDTEAVHDFRVASRSLRAALRTLARRREGRLVRAARRALRIATRSRAGARVRVVGRQLLMKRTATLQAEKAFRRRVFGLSESDRRLALAESAALWPKNLDRLLIRLLGRETPVATVIRRSRAEAWSQRRRAIALLQSLGRKYDPIALHDVRRRVRSLRYAIEVLAEVDSTAQARVIRLKPLQSGLGDIQDLIVLSRWLAGQASRFRTRDPRLAAALRRESARFKAQSQKAHREFLRLKPVRVLEGLALHVDPHTEGPVKERRRGRNGSSR
jgi:CHAD domain-containing protein